MQVEIITIEKAELERLIRRTASLVADDLRSDLESHRIPELMTKTELADYLRCDASKINRYMQTGLPFEQFGGHPRFRKTDIDQWLKSSKTKVIEIAEAVGIQ